MNVIFGNALPPVEESHVGDIFHNIITGYTYQFDNGAWAELETGAGKDYPPALKASLKGFEYNPFAYRSDYDNVEVNPKNLELKNIVFGGGNTFTSSDVAGHAATNGNFVVGYLNNLGEVCDYNTVLGLYDNLSHVRYGVVIGHLNNILNTSGKPYAIIIGSYNNVQPDMNEPILIGNELTGNRNYQTVLGYGNDPTRTARFVVGDGYLQGSEVVRHNALEIDKDDETGEYSMKLGDTTVKESELGGGGIGVISTFTYGSVILGLRCSNHKALQYAIETEGGIVPIFYNNLEKVENATVTDADNLFTYDSTGTTTAYVGTKNFYVLTDIAQLDGTDIIAVPAETIKSADGSIMIDSDTGEIIYYMLPN